MAAGSLSSPAGRDEPTPPGWAAWYVFGGKREAVTVVRILASGSVLVARRGGWLDAVPHHRIRLRRDELP
ncbi:MAG: hypothetical protein M3N29_09020 [Chloroflexota bacterium]|nr:hypothetical protein [Chloroflexota bacterium]